jgi:beta-lactamase regulating signal transducer with metallopeptidase domain
MSEIEIRTATFLLSVVAKATLLFAVAALAIYLLHRSSAAFRHFVLATILGAVLLLPFVSLTLSRSPLGLLTVHSPLPVVLSPTNSSAHVVLPKSAFRLDRDLSSGISLHCLPLTVGQMSNASQPIDAKPSNLAVVKSTGSPWWNIGILQLVLVVAAVLWLIGAALLTFRLVASVFKTARERQASEPVSERIQDLANIAAHLLDLRQPVIVLQSNDPDGISVPVTWGLTHPTILLPSQAEDWSDGCICSALMHEMAHIKRYDWSIQTLAQVLCVIHWFNPLAWQVANQVRSESESATDDIVLASGLSPADYAQSLIEVVRSMPPLPHRSLTAVAMASPLDVNKRVLAILDKGRDRSPIGRYRSTVAIMVLCLFSVPVAALRVNAQSAVPGPAMPRPPAVPSPNALPTPPELPTLNAAPTMPVAPTPTALPAPPAIPALPATTPTPSEHHPDQISIIETDDPKTNGKKGSEATTKTRYRIVFISAKDESDASLKGEMMAIKEEAKYEAENAKDMQKVKLLLKLQPLQGTAGLSPDDQKELQHSLAGLSAQLSRLGPTIEKDEICTKVIDKDEIDKDLKSLDAAKDTDSTESRIQVDDNSLSEADKETIKHDVMQALHDQHITQDVMKIVQKTLDQTAKDQQ